MFCPKCGLQNADDTRFCRGCGAELGNVLAALDAPVTKTQKSLAEKSVALYSRGIRGSLTAVGFLVIAGILRSIPPENGILWLLPLTFAFVWLAASISRFVQARGLKKLAAQERPAELGAGRVEFLKPSRSIYQTDDLVPMSVTERTTTLLERLDDDDDI
jgi:hypothetical protein